MPLGFGVFLFGFLGFVIGAFSHAGGGPSPAQVLHKPPSTGYRGRVGGGAGTVAVCPCCPRVAAAHAVLGLPPRIMEAGAASSQGLSTRLCGWCNELGGLGPGLPISRLRFREGQAEGVDKCVEILCDRGCTWKKQKKKKKTMGLCVLQRIGLFGPGLTALALTFSRRASRGS